MGKYLQIVDNLIDKIPGHIQDLIKKGFYAIVAMAALFAILIAIRKGMADAPPPGLQLSKTARDLYYLEELREENAKREQLIEDIETTFSEEFEEDKDITGFVNLGRDTLGHLVGEKDEMLTIRGTALLPEDASIAAPSDPVDLEPRNGDFPRRQAESAVTQPESVPDTQESVNKKSLQDSPLPFLE